MTTNETDKAMLKLAIQWGMNSKAKRMKVGALLIKNQQVISDGFNGTPTKFDNACEEIVDGQLKTKDTVLHAESNAISKLAKNGGLGSDGSTIYVTVSPCLNCAKLIIQAGIKRVVYAIDYRDDAGTKLLKEAGLELVNLPVLQDFYDTLLSQEQN